MAKAKSARSKRMRNSVVFLITFVAFLIIFGGLMIWGVSEFWRQSTEQPTPPAPQSTVSGYTAADTRRLLLITEYDGAAQGFVLLSAEPENARIRAIAIPRETVATIGTTQSRLFELYRTGGSAAVTEQAAALLGVSIDNTAVISYDNIQRLVTHLGSGVIFTLDEAVSYQNADGATVTMKSGARTLSAAQTTDLLRYTGWSNGLRGQANMPAQLTAALINQYFTPSHFDEGDTDFHAIMNLWRSDIFASQFAQARDSLLFLAKHNQNNLCTVLSPAGEYIGVGDATRFEMAENPLN